MGTKKKRYRGGAGEATFVKIEVKGVVFLWRKDWEREGKKRRVKGGERKKK